MWLAHFTVKGRVLSVAHCPSNLCISSCSLPRTSLILFPPPNQEFKALYCVSYKHSILTRCWASLYNIHKSNPFIIPVTNNGKGFLLAFFFSYCSKLMCWVLFWKQCILIPSAHRGLCVALRWPWGIQRCACRKPSPGSGKALLSSTLLPCCLRKAFWLTQLISYACCICFLFTLSVLCRCIFSFFL